MDYWIAIVCLLMGAVLLWIAWLKLSPADHAKLDAADAARRSYGIWVWLAVGLAYPFLSNVVRAVVLCVALMTMMTTALQRWLRHSRMGLPRTYLWTRLLGEVLCFTAAAMVCARLVHEALAQKG